MFSFHPCISYFISSSTFKLSVFCVIILYVLMTCMVFCSVCYGMFEYLKCRIKLNFMKWC